MRWGRRELERVRWQRREKTRKMGNLGAGGRVRGSNPDLREEGRERVLIWSVWGAPGCGRNSYPARGPPSWSLS